MCCGKRNMRADSRKNPYGCEYDDVRATFIGTEREFVYTERANVYRWLNPGDVLCVAKLDIDDPRFELVPLESS